MSDILNSGNVAVMAGAASGIGLAAGDVTESRPPLSRSHQDWQDKFK